MTIDEPLYRLSFDMMSGDHDRFGFLWLDAALLRFSHPNAPLANVRRGKNIASKAAEYRELFYVLARHWWTRILNDETPPQSEEVAIIQSIHDIVDRSITAVQRVFRIWACERCGK